ncbi:MAG: hypothetical protein AAF211_28635 [Myxococcota bacterium]
MRGLVMMALVGCVDFVDLDCEASTFALDTTGEVPHVRFVPVTTGGESPERVVTFGRMISDPDSFCAQGGITERIWRVEGDFDEVSYLEVPEGARESFNADDRTDDDGRTTELVDGTYYIVDVFTEEGYGCASWSRIWRQGVQGVVGACDFEAGELVPVTE